MTDREKVIAAYECSNEKLPDKRCEKCPFGYAYLDQTGDNYFVGCNIERIMVDAIDLLKAQEPATVEPKRIELADETKAWLDKMDAVDALGNIADICMDWDGYRTANGLGGLVNEIWAYARYCANRLSIAQEPVEPKKNDVELAGLRTWDWACPECNCILIYRANYCSCCGRAVKWE